LSSEIINAFKNLFFYCGGSAVNVGRHTEPLDNRSRLIDNCDFNLCAAEINAKRPSSHSKKPSLFLHYSVFVIIPNQIKERSNARYFTNGLEPAS